jgi:hypothetical protein
VEDIKGKKIEITVPDGYRFLQQGNSCYFVKKRVKNFLSWENKEAGLTGYFVSKNSRITEFLHDEDDRTLDNRNVFYNSEQARGALALAMLSQQLEDVNLDWKPEWCSDEVKYCIVRDCVGNSYELNIEECTNRYHFLAFKTEQDAAIFISKNEEELLRASVFI